MKLPAPSFSRAPYVTTRTPLSRRRFLQGVGVAMSLPFLESMLPGIARAATPSALTPGSTPRRMLGICNNLGLLPDQFFPQGEGRDYVASPYLELLQAHREDFTVFSGVSHPNVDGGHPSDISFLSAAPHPASSSFRNTISLDQHIAESIGPMTRFPSLTLAVNTASRSLSWTGSGVAIPPEESAASVFNQLFLQGTPEQVERQVHRLDTGRSILDTIGGQAKDLSRSVGSRDRSRLDQYFTSVRHLENRLQASKTWERMPKPQVDAPAPVDPASPALYMAKVRNMYDLARLAFENDSTRAITLMLNSVGTPVVAVRGANITEDYHNLSHHGKSEDKLNQLQVLDQWQMRLLNNLLTDLKAVREEEESLLDRTMVLYGSNLGDANAHSTTNMPTLFAGGGFRHGQHLAFKGDSDYPLPNLFVSMLQRMGIEDDKFASSTGTMRGLEVA